MLTGPITLSMKQRIDALRARFGHAASSHAFASLYIWQKDMGLSVHLEDDLFAVRCLWRGDNAWFFPCGEERAIRRFLMEAMREAHFRLNYLRAEDARFLEQSFPGLFQIAERPDDYEYLYDRAAFQALKGGKYAALRNHIHRAEADHVLRAKPLCESNLAAALEINRRWQRTSGALGGLLDISAPALLFENWRELKVQGAVIFADGEPCAVVAGYPLTKNTFDISLAKQDIRFSGLSVYAKHALVQLLPEQYEFLNAEEDLGIPGLRTMKRQMQPIGQLMMYEGVARAD